MNCGGSFYRVYFLLTAIAYKHLLCFSLLTNVCVRVFFHWSEHPKSNEWKHLADWCSANARCQQEVYSAVLYPYHSMRILYKVHANAHMFGMERSARVSILCWLVHLWIDRILSTCFISDDHSIQASESLELQLSYIFNIFFINSLLKGTFLW